MSSNRRFLFLVEGEDTEVKLLNQILACFPEISLRPDDILIFRTNIWVLCDTLNRDIGENWYDDDIDFLNFLRSSTNVCQQLNGFDTASVTDIFLIFDYERQDPRFDANLLKHMMNFWNNSTENGLLYINYPMIESFNHIKSPFPDLNFLTRKIECSKLCMKQGHKNLYKVMAKNESSFPDLSNIDRDTFKELTIHHFCKASAILYGSSDISESTACQIWNNIDNIRLRLLDEQNILSADLSSGFVYVIATCLWFICEYNSSLVFSQ